MKRSVCDSSVIDSFGIQEEISPNARPSASGAMTDGRACEYYI